MSQEPVSIATVSSHHLPVGHYNAIEQRLAEMRALTALLDEDQPFEVADLMHRLEAIDS